MSTSADGDRGLAPVSHASNQAGHAESAEKRSVVLRARPREIFDHPTGLSSGVATTTPFVTDPDNTSRSPPFRSRGSTVANHS